MAQYTIAVATAQIEKDLHLSSKRAFFSTVEAGDCLFFVGGFEHSDYVASSTIDIYNLTSGSWEQPISLPSPRGRVSTNVIGPRIYMIGGQSFSCLPFEYLSENNTFSSVGFTSGPTVRRPVRLALDDTTLTVIGQFSVDFMDLTSGQWTHNTQLTTLMSELFDTTTLSHNGMVFVIGGTHITTQQPSTSVWIVDSPTSTPIEHSARVAGSYVSSWFDSTHHALVLQFSEGCSVYNTNTQSWHQIASRNNSVSTVSYQNSTVVFFTDGFWTIKWTANNSTWTPLNGIRYGFAIGDQLVFIADNQMTVVTPGMLETTTIGEVGTIFFGAEMSPSIYVLVNSAGPVYKYNADMRILEVAFSITYTPLGIFSKDDSVFVFGQEANNIIIVLTTTSTSSMAVPAIPDVMIKNNFFNFQFGVWTTTEQPAVGKNISPFTNSVWGQRGDSFFLMQSSSDKSSVPITSEPYSSVDVYNYEESRWENSIPAGFGVPVGGINTAVLDGALHAIVNLKIFRLNDTGGWSEYSSPGVRLPLSHPTFSPIPVIDNTAYLRELLSGVSVLRADGQIRR
ncbi:hypothetical protein HW132_35010, partial [Brasilonema sp. CT11]|nr:hypothetical protein [Brasilonema sp. CT11]